ncbi:MAG: sortase [Anaerolineae bacterium]
MKRILAALVALSFLLSACGGPLDLTGAGTTSRRTPTTVRTPTRRASPTRGATPTPSPTPSLAGGRIVISRIALDVPLTEVSWSLVVVEGQTVGQWQAPPAGQAAHLLGTDMATNCVITGHSAAVRGGVFGRLGELVAGDEIRVVDAAGAVHAYVVERVDKVQEVGATLEVRRANAQAALAAPADGAARLTLITCWPDWAYTHRLVVVARPQAVP